MIDQPEDEPVRRRPGPPSDAIKGMADALIRRLGGAGAEETRDEVTGSLALFGAAPKRLGRFEIEGELGAGAMGVVYAARDPMLRRDVAIKLLARHRTSDEALTRARREAKALARISHPNVVKVFAIGDHEGSLYIAMERIYGETLAQWQADRPRTTDDVLVAYRQAGLGLAELHSVGLVHRDFKPANAMIADDGRVCVLDLGLVRELGDPSPSLEQGGDGPNLRLSSGSTTMSNALLGTPAYMSPEQFLGRPVGAETDQFSFCVSLFEALYGHRPFSGSTMAQVVEAMAKGRVEPPRADSRVPRGVHRALLRGLSHEPERRFPSMQALLIGLEPRSTKWMWLGGVTAIGVLAALSPIEISAREQICLLETRFDQVWAPGRQHDLARIYGPAAVERLTAYASELDALVLEACGSPSPSHEPSCHRQLVERFDGAIELLLERSDQADAQAITSGLPPTSSCVDTPALGGDPEQVADLSRRLQRASALAISGLLDDALAEADELVSEAQRLAVPEVTQAAFRTRGEIQARRRALQPAVDDFTASYELAVILGDHVQRSRLALSLIWVTRENRDLDAAEHWLRVADAAYEASGRTDPDTGVRIVQRRGEILLARGDLAEARDALLSAAGGWKQQNNPREEAGALTQLVWPELELGDLDLATQHAERAVRILREAFGDEEPQLGTAYQNLGNALQRQGRQRETLDAFTEAVERRIAVYGEEHPSTAFAMYSRGAALMGLREYEQAKPVLLKARDNIPPTHHLQDACNMMLAVVASAEGDHDEAISLASNAWVGLEAKLGPSHSSAGEARTNLAKIQLEAGDAASALESARAAREIVEAASMPDDGNVAVALIVEANALVALDRRSEARPLYERALCIRVRSDGEDSERVAELREELRALDEK